MSWLAKRHEREDERHDEFCAVWATVEPDQMLRFDLTDVPGDPEALRRAIKRGSERSTG